MINPEKKYLSVSEAAELLGVTPITIRAYCDAGKLNYFRTPGNQRRIPKEGVLIFRKFGTNNFHDLSPEVQKKWGFVDYNNI